MDDVPAINSNYFRPLKYNSDGTINVNAMFGSTSPEARACVHPSYSREGQTVYVVYRNRTNNSVTYSGTVYYYYQYLGLWTVRDGYFVALDSLRSSAGATQYVNLRGYRPSSTLYPNYIAYDLPQCVGWSNDNGQTSVDSYSLLSLPNPYQSQRLNANFYAFVLAFLVLALAFYTVIYKWWRRRL